MTVEHIESQHRFVIRLPEGNAELRYLLRPNGVMELYHSETDPALRGRGMAAAVAAGAFAWAREHGAKVRVTCPYVTTWLKKHPEAGDVVVP